MNESKPQQPPRRTGDIIQIGGDYQHRALLEGPPAQRAWHRIKLNLLEWRFTPQPGESVLEIGCGSGVFANEMARLGARVVALDANVEAANYAQKTFATKNLSVVRGLMDEIPARDRAFDRVTCLEVIEHVHPPQVRSLLADCYRVLKPGGSLLLTTPNYRGLWPLVEWIADRSGSTASMDSDQHVTKFNRPMLRGFLKDAGFVNITLRNFSTFAPFVAPVSARFSRALDRAERRVDLPFGNILTAVAVRP